MYGYMLTITAIRVLSRNSFPVDSKLACCRSHDERAACGLHARVVVCCKGQGVRAAAACALTRDRDLAEGWEAQRFVGSEVLSVLLRF